MALCTSYLRMTQGSNDRTYRRIIVAVANISTFSHIIFVVLYLCQCVPVSLYPSPRKKKEKEKENHLLTIYLVIGNV